MTPRDPATRLMVAVDRLLLGGEPAYSRDELLARTRISEPVARAMWRAMGFPDSRGARIFTDRKSVV